MATAATARAIRRLQFGLTLGWPASATHSRFAEFVEGYEFEASAFAGGDELGEGVDRVLGAVVEENDAAGGQGGRLGFEEDAVAGVGVIAGVIRPQDRIEPL